MKGSTRVENISAQLGLFIAFINDDNKYPKGVFMVIEPYSGEDFFYLTHYGKEFEVDGECYLITDPKDLQDHIDAAVERGNNFFFKPKPE